MTNILTDKTNKALISMSLPISIGMLSTFLFQVIDTYFVGQLGPSELAALSFSSTIFFLLIGSFIGLSVGVSIIIGQAAGNGNMDKVKKATWIAILVAFILAAFLVTISIIFVEPIFTLLGADGDTIPLIKEYIVPILVGIPLVTTGLLIGGVLRATGNVTKPEVIMAVAGVINLVLDYGLIFGKWGLPEMRIAGAAYATIISWVFVLLGMFALLLKDRLLNFRAKAEESIKEIISEIFNLGSPTVLTQIIGPLTLMYLTFLLAKESSLAVAAFGVAARIEILLMIGILGVSTALTPFIAQNAGAKKQERIEQAIVFGGKASTYLGLLVALLLILFIKPIAGIFSENLSVIQYTSDYFYIVSISYVLYGLFLITTSIFNGLKHPINSLKLSVVKSLGFTVPLTLIGSIWGINGIFIGLSLSNVLGGLYAGREMKKEITRDYPHLAEVSVWQDYLKDIKAAYRFLTRRT